MTPDVVLVDSGGANIGSVRYALARIGVDAPMSDDADRIAKASHVILPGVGAAATAMEQLRANELDQVIPRLEQPVLGICLGMQLLYEGSEEGDVACLGVLGGRARRFQASRSRRVPHMGWNRVHKRGDDPLLDLVDDGEHAYFVHSYALPVTDQTIATCDYGQPFAAMARKGNFCAAQFHPERSSRLGDRLLRNFLATPAAPEG